MKTKILLIIFSLSAIVACTFDPIYETIDKQLEFLLGDKSKFELPAANDFANIPQSEANPLTQEKVDLGKLLFFEPVFGVESKHFEGRQTFSCGSCHIPSAGFRPGRKQGIADGGYGFGDHGEKRVILPIYEENEIDAQGARPLSVLNVAFVTNSMWNGSFGSDHVNEGTEDMWGVFDPGTAINHERLGNLEGQNIEGLKTHRLLFTKELVEDYGYKHYFDSAFPDVPKSERYTRKTASFAISAYLRSLLTNQAPFQKWLKGDKDAMTEQQKRGAVLFFGELGCVSCHSEANLGSNTFHALGVKDLYENGGFKTDIHDRRNMGRGGFTGRDEDMFKFRVPQLYNLGDGGPYFHGASKESLEEVIDYFNNGIAENGRVPKEQLSPYLQPLGMTAEQKADLLAFIRDGLRDPNLQRYVPNQVLSGMCFPNNDPLSKHDMNCN